MVILFLELVLIKIGYIFISVFMQKLRMKFGKRLIILNLNAHFDTHYMSKGV